MEKYFNSLTRYLITFIFIFSYLIHFSANASSYDFSSEYNGHTIYYEILTDSTLSVSYKGIDIKSYKGDVEIPDTLTYNGVKYHVVEIGKYAFLSCDSLTSIVIPNSVIDIRDFAFQSCTAITFINLPDSLNSIGRGSFKSCTALTAIHLASKLTTIPPCAFMNCSTLSNVYIGGNIRKIDTSAFESCSGLTNVTIGDSVQTIGMCAFQLCTNLQSIAIPDATKIVENFAFYSCGNLRNVKLGQTNNGTQLTRLSRNSFAYCTRLIKTTLMQTTPPMIFDDTFTGCEYKHIWHVPCSTKAIYDTTEYWRDLDSIEEDACVGITEISNNNTVSLYPNPANTEIIIESPNMEAITISNLLGQRVYYYKIIGVKKHIINVADLKKGLYIVQISNHNGNVITKKLEIQ
ncbi:MAG: leucine-rich repeat protein [Bacteroidales bacterium]|jgi:hypothetical protein|nr:leucine-rich repeat protein [Bacteroidales bacterium]